MAQVAKLTISLPRDLLSLVNELAKEAELSRSRFIAVCLRDRAEQVKQAQMKEGYEAMAEEQRKFAAAALALAGEVLPEWE